MDMNEVITQAQALWPGKIEADGDARLRTAELRCGCEQTPEVCDWLFNRQGYHFTGLVVEEADGGWELFYLFTGEGEKGLVQVKNRAPLQQRRFPSISERVHPADWHEREAEDLFGLVFEGHPRLGDFILHDDAWQEGVEPMRSAFDPARALSNRKPQEDWRPRRIVSAPGAFIMPVGPVFSGEAESVHFQLETIGEEILRASPRLFFKYRGVEKKAEECSPDEGLLLAERFAATTAFSHALAFCRAAEQAGGVEPPRRARTLRVFLAELERVRHHIGTIEGICNSTGLAVAANQAGILEEETLRLAGALTGHRYLFGLAVPGGLSRDLDDPSCRQAVGRAKEIVRRLNGLEKLLTETSSFLDRIEEVGIITQDQARNYGLVGPVARGSGYGDDLRRSRPYGGYEDFDFVVPCEREGDGYARLRVLFEETRQAVRIMEQAVTALTDGPTGVSCMVRPGIGVAGVETPRGAAWHWVRFGEDGKLVRYRLITPSFANWHGVHLAVENFAFQDFPIILATFGLSVAENDR